MFIAALFKIIKIWKQPKWPSTDEWIKKMWNIYMEYIYIYIYMEYIYIYIWNITQPLKKYKILPFATTWMDLEGIMLSEISQRKTNTI